MFILMKFNNEHYTVGWRQLKVRTSYKSLLLQGCVTFYGEFSLHFRAPPPYFPNIFYYGILFIIEYKRYMSKKTNGSIYSRVLPWWSIKKEERARR